MYNGHKNWNHWNVSLWIGNDEGLYRMALECIRSTRNLAEATDSFLERIRMSERQPGKTPDGATYNKSTVRAALAGLV